MTAVTFPVNLGGDGSTVTDDANATTGLGNGGHRQRFVPSLQQAVAVMNGAVTQAAAAQAAAEAASTATIWVSGGNYAIGAVRWSPITYLIYRCVATANGRTTDPSTDVGFWILVGVSLPPLTVSASTSNSAISNSHIILTNAAASTVTLPAAPNAGDLVMVTVANGRTDNVVARNGKNIMGLAEDMTLDNQYSAITLRFANNTIGWRLV